MECLMEGFLEELCHIFNRKELRELRKKGRVGVEALGRKKGMAKLLRSGSSTMHRC